MALIIIPRRVLSAILSLLFVLMAYQSQSQCGNQLLLNTWGQRGPSGNGNWQVASDGKSVLQTVNGQPTFFVSPDSISNTTVRGSFSVNTGGDDDFIGFVFGFKGPAGTGTDYDFYLFDWKQNNQSSGGYGYEGFTLARVRGNSTNFWTHSGADITVLDTKYSTSLGWADFTTYQFQLTFTDTTITILIDTDTIFDVKNDTATFQNGLFGFYNYSQAQVQYNNFTDNACPVALDDSATVIENGAVTISVLENDSDADVGNVLSVSSIFSAPANGSVLISGDNVIYIPGIGYSGSDSFEYLVSDGVGGIDTATVSVTVVDVSGPYAFDLLGNSIAASVPHPADGSFDIAASQDFTVELWFKIANMSGHQVMIQKGDDTLAAVGMSDGQVYAVLKDGLSVDSAISTNSYDDTTWHHVAVVVDRNAGMQIIVDGIVDGVDNALGVGALTTTNDLGIGGWNGNHHFNGLLDEVRLWRGVISQADIQRLMHQRITSVELMWSDLMAYYQMDEGSGITLYDYSANNNEGTLSQASWLSLAPANPILAGDINVTENFTYPYMASLGNGDSRLWNFDWSATNGSVAQVSQDSLQADVVWNIGQVSGSLDLQVTHSNYGSMESATTLNITINAPILYEDSLAICQGDSIFLNGTWQKTSAAFTDTVHLANDLDSIYNVELHVIPSKTNTQMLSICDGDSILLGGAWQYASGSFTDTLQSISGCDSILTSTLTVNPVFSSSSSTSIQPGDSLLIAGQYRTTAGIYTDSLTSVAGCDSLHTTTLSVNVVDRYFTFTGNVNYTNSVIYPLTGSPYTTFNIEVTYYDLNGVLPPFGYPRAILDFEGNGNYNNGKDRNIIMSEADASDTDPTDGKVYTASINALPFGTNYETVLQVVENGDEVLFGPFGYPDVLAQPDLEVFANHITFSNTNPPVNSSLTVSATVTNTSDYVANNFVVHLVNQYDTNLVYPDTVIASLPPQSSATVSWDITTPPVDAWCPMEVSVDYTDVISEVNELDNVAIRPFINGDYNLPGTILIFPNVSPEVRCSSPGAKVGVSGYAYYTGTAVPIKDSSVAGAEVTIRRAGATYKGLTNSRGYFSMSIPSPVTQGVYDFDIEVTDFTLTGDNRDTFEVISCPCTLPDLYASISLSNNTIQVGGSVSGTIKVTNYGCDTAETSGLRVTQTGGVPPLVDQTIPRLGPGQSFSYQFLGLTFNSTGTYSICAKADSANIIVEQSEGNNYACANVRVIVPIPDLHPYTGPSGSRFVCSGDFTPSFTVRNTGTAAAGPFDCRVITRFNGAVVDTNYHSFAGLAAGGIAGFSIPPVSAMLGSYTFSVTCDIPDMVVESNETNNSGGFGVTYLECKPDLVISGCNNLKVLPADPPAPGPVTFEALVRNSGNDTAFAPIAVQFTIAGGAVYNAQINTDMLPGQSETVVVNATSVSSGPINLEVKVDPFNAINEFSESNNSQGDELCYEFMPIRRCGTYGINFWERSYSVNQTAYLAVGLDVDNLYRASAVDVQFEVSGPGIAGVQNLGVATVNNPIKTCGCPYTAALPTNFVFNNPGTYTFTMTVDPNNTYPECNESNNVKVVTVSVYNNIPDMRVLSQFIQPSKLNPEVGDSVDLNITYENIGSSNIGQYMELKVLVNNLPLDSIKPVFGLVKNDNTTYKLPTRWGSALPGIHIIRAIIDSDNEVVESNELNNEATRAIVVGEASNLFFAEFSVSNTSPNNGDMIQINAKVANNGDVDNDGDVEFSYINDLQDTILIGTMPVVVPHGDTAMTSIIWTVLDSSTTLIGEIVNSTEIEYTYNDNRATAAIGAFGVNIVSVAGCAGNTNGSLTAAVTGGVAPISFSWSNGANGPVLNDVPGIYTLEVTDGTGFSVITSDTIDTISGSLTVLPQMTICSGDSALVFGMYQKQSGVYYDTLPSSGGCDSIVQKTLLVYPKTTTPLVGMSICQGDSLEIFGQYRKLAGLYYDTLQNVFGCDSVLIKELMVRPSYASTLPALTICDGDSALVWGNYQNMAGVYKDTLPAANGCDSIISQELIVLPRANATTTDSLCGGDSLLVGGMWQKDAGTYYDTLMAANGCDSLLTTIIYNKPTSACGGDTTVVSLICVSDIGWAKSTVVTPTNLSGAWGGVNGILPPAATFTLPADVGQPYPWPHIHLVPGSDPIKTESDISYFRKTFNLANNQDLEARFRMNVDDQAEIYANGVLVARLGSFGRMNYKNPAHDVLLYGTGMADNPYLGGDPYAYVTSANLSSIFTSGTNELILVIRNLGKPHDRGGFSFRMDISTEGTGPKSAIASSGLGPQLILFPNPTQSEMHLQMQGASEDSKYSLTITDVNGRTLQMESVLGSDLQEALPLDVSGFAAGLYMLTISDGTYQSTQAFVKF